ncbi:serine/arginine repetitive matrix protein 1-like [Panthera uncia]|uniref:serine/arginine repetitive matrix protein 1-like n=1 Tax=Panthera uncia TaxID=29064 RepID=UPI0020FFDE39|nr:serine/arginine repetitive matrix protein 1-like [Panthera uncia]
MKKSALSFSVLSSLRRGRRSPTRTGREDTPGVFLKDLAKAAKAPGTELPGPQRGLSATPGRACAAETPVPRARTPPDELSAAAEPRQPRRLARPQPGRPRRQRRPRDKDPGSHDAPTPTPRRPRSPSPWRGVPGGRRRRRRSRHRRRHLLPALGVARGGFSRRGGLGRPGPRARLHAAGPRGRGQRPPPRLGSGARRQRAERGGGRRVGGGAPGRRSLRPLPAVCEVCGGPPGAPFAGSVTGVRRRRLPGLGTACAAAAARARLQIPDPREPWLHTSAIWAPSPLHIYDLPSHCLASGFPLTVSKTLEQEGARGCWPTGGGAEGKPEEPGAVCVSSARGRTALFFGMRVGVRLLAAAVPLLRHLGVHFA